MMPPPESPPPAQGDEPSKLSLALSIDKIKYIFPTFKVFVNNVVDFATGFTSMRRVLTKTSSSIRADYSMISVVVLVVAWVAGGGLFLSGMIRGAPNDHFRDCLSAVRRAEPAAVVALGLFIVVWPMVWIFAHVTK